MDKSRLIKLNQWTLDPVNNTLIDPDNKKTTIEAKYAVLLEYLAKSGDELVTRDQLIQDVWQDRHVEYRTVNSAISRLRKILGGKRDDFIKTHPKLGYSLNCRIEFLGKGIPITTKSNKTKYIIYCLITSFTLLCVLLLKLSLSKPEQVKINIPKPLPVLTEKEITIEPLTYMDGWEYFPTLSNDESLLAFTQQPKKGKAFKVAIQHLESNQTITLTPNDMSTSPLWSPHNNELFYKKLSKGKCYIEKVQVLANLTVSTPDGITSCGRYEPLSDFNSLAVSSDLSWLYFIYNEAATKPRVIKRYHLKNHQTQTLTAPPITFAGELKLSLSPDNNKLAFMRERDDFSTEIMILNLKSGELESIHKSPYLPYSLTWSKSGEKLLYVSQSGYALNAIDIVTKKSTLLYQHSKQILDPVIVSDTELLLSLGDLHNANIKQVDLSDSTLPTKSLINSSFKDHSAAVYNNNGQEHIAFVSNRSGNYQIWLLENEQLKQLTQFKNTPYIEELSFSANGKNLLFYNNRKLHALNINSKVITPITHPTESIKNFIWQCHSDENVLIIAKNNGLWGLYQTSVVAQTSKLLTTGITSIHSLCDNKKTHKNKKITNTKDSYFAASLNKSGIFQLTNNWNIDKSKRYLEHQIDIDFSDNRLWAVSSFGIYYIGNEPAIYQYNFTTEKQIQIKLSDINTYYLSIQYNKLILNDLKVADTFIGKIIIPDLDERLTNQ